MLRGDGVLGENPLAEDSFDSEDPLAESSVSSELSALESSSSSGRPAQAFSWGSTGKLGLGPGWGVGVGNLSEGRSPDLESLVPGLLVLCEEWKTVILHSGLVVKEASH